MQQSKKPETTPSQMQRVGDELNCHMRRAGSWFSPAGSQFAQASTQPSIHPIARPRKERKKTNRSACQLPRVNVPVFFPSCLLFLLMSPCDHRPRPHGPNRSYIELTEARPRQFPAKLVSPPIGAIIALPPSPPARSLMLTLAGGPTIKPCHHCQFTTTLRRRAPRHS